MIQLVLSNSIQSYLIQANRFPLLSADEEFELAVRLKKYNDLDAAHKLITSNLRFVVKIAMEYRNYGIKLADLIQEGNIGLMKAVKKFDPFKKYRLITYAVWWIRSHIQAFILKNWSLVSKGTVALKKRLFYQLENTKLKLKAASNGIDDTLPMLHNLLPVDIECRDFSLDKEIKEKETTYLDMLPDTSHNHEDIIEMAQTEGIIKKEISNAIQILNKNELYVIENRIMTEAPLTLQEIGDKLSLSRERVRQIEEQAIKKLKKVKKLQNLITNI